MIRPEQEEAKDWSTVEVPNYTQFDWTDPNLNPTNLNRIHSKFDSNPSLNPNQIQRNVAAWKDKKLKLANPNFFVSPTRLAIRGIPPHVTEAQLKKLFVEHGVVKHGEEEIRGGVNHVCDLNLPSES